MSARYVFHSICSVSGARVYCWPLTITFVADQLAGVLSQDSLFPLGTPVYVYMYAGGMCHHPRIVGRCPHIGWGTRLLFKSAPYSCVCVFDCLETRELIRVVCMSSPSLRMPHYWGAYVCTNNTHTSVRVSACL